MQSKRTELSKILRKLADYLDSRADEDLAPIFDQAQALARSAKPKKARPTLKTEKVSPPDVKSLSETLMTLQSRETGELFLKENVRNKAGLEAVARFLGLPVQRDDKVDRLRAKIVENTIGSRLRSDAIQGKGGGSY